MNKKITRIVLTVFFVVPVVYMIMWAFVESWPYNKMVPQLFTVRAWKSLLTNKDNLTIILKSIGISSSVAILSIVFTYPAAKAIALYNFKFKSVFRVILFIPILLPVMSLAIGLHLNFLRFSLANKVPGVMIVHIFQCIPYCFLIIEPVISSVGINYENQARLLGANDVQTLIHINLPLYLPALLAAFFMSFIVSFSQYIVNFLIGGGLVNTFSTVIFPILKEKDRHVSSVYSVVFLLICFAVYFVSNYFSRRMVENNE